MDSPHAPLADWRYDGVLRPYQAEVLEQLPPHPADAAMHIVAPPGSGKTLLGLLLAAREQQRALVLAPNLTVRQQWVRTARTLATHEDQVSDDPERLAELTVLTYQLLSVTGDSSSFNDLARAQWADEFVEAGRTQVDAETWLATIAADNRAQYLRGLRKRAASLRRRFTQARPDLLARVLHPNAVALIDRLVASGVDTIVLDECHHLLDHWAIVVAYLRARIREHGGTGLVIGLTATLPAADDGPGYENYTGLLGDVDYEVPTPAVVKAGHLAPYRAHVWFTEPVPAEAHFIRRSDAQLHELMMQVLGSADGLAYLESQLQPADPDAADHRSSDESRRRGIDRALSDDFALARACGAVLGVADPQHPLCAFLAPQVFGRPTTDDLLRVLARFALTRLLPEPAARDQWRYVKGALADFGLHLTDRGIRRGRDPLEATLAASVAKDHAAIDILRHEVAAEDGARVRAVVVTDAVEAGDNRGLTGAAAPGALRVFDLLASDPTTAALNPVLLTAQHLRTTAAGAAGIAGALRETLGAEVTIDDGFGPTRVLRVAGFGGGRLVAAVSQLVTDGAVRALVGTRGLLGEGWDCPAVNTLIDLTTVATSTGTQQLRGRTLRLDPAWPEKVAHNWSVLCLIPPQAELDSPAELQRLHRRHSHLWGLSADDHSSVVTGVETALDRDARELLRRFVAKDRSVTIDELNRAVLAGIRSRAQTRADWRVGEPYISRERDVVAVRSSQRTELVQVMPAALAGATLPFALTTLASGAAVALAGGWLGWEVPFMTGAGIAVGAGVLAVLGRTAGSLVRSVRHRRDPALAYLAIAQAIAEALRDAGRVPPLAADAIDVDRQREISGALRLRLTFQGPAVVRRMLADAVQEMLGPIRTPRFLLRIPAHPVVYLPVPTQIARRRADAEHFAQLWQQQIGLCRLVELKGEEGLEVLRVARSQPGRVDESGARTTLWG